MNNSHFGDDTQDRTVLNFDSSLHKRRKNIEASESKLSKKPKKRLNLDKKIRPTKLSESILTPHFTH